MKAIGSILKENPDGSRGVAYRFKQASLEDNLWFMSLEEMGNILHDIFRAENLKYLSKGGEGGEFTLRYLCERSRGAKHNDIKHKYHFKKQTMKHEICKSFRKHIRKMKNEIRKNFFNLEDQKKEIDKLLSKS